MLGGRSSCPGGNIYVFGRFCLRRPATANSPGRQAGGWSVLALCPCPESSKPTNQRGPPLLASSRKESNRHCHERKRAWPQHAASIWWPLFRSNRSFGKIWTPVVVERSLLSPNLEKKRAFSESSRLPTFSKWKIAFHSAYNNTRFGN